jgi:hypothetical protein
MGIIVEFSSLQVNSLTAVLTSWDEMDVCVSLDVNNDCCCYCGIDGSEIVAITTRWNIITYLCSSIALSKVKMQSVGLPSTPVVRICFKVIYHDILCDWTWRWT